MADEFPERPEFQIDPFWAEHRGDIRRVKEAIECPQTEAGKKAWNEVLADPFFKVFSRIHPIYGSLLAVMEYDEIAIERGEENFLGLERQRMILRALNLRIEDAVKASFDSSEMKGYKDYRQFLEETVDRFRILDSQIQKGTRGLSFVNSLFSIFIKEVNTLRGNGFNPRIGDIRVDIANGLSQEDDHFLRAVLDKMPSEQPLEVEQEERV